jgi:hypothetical protein
MRTYKFKVEGLPPKKDGAQSMWGKPLEARRLMILRHAAFKAFKGQPPLKTNIKLTLKIHIPVNNKSIGDLDTFVTGVCDGLMAAPRKGILDPIWDLDRTWENGELLGVDGGDAVSIHPSKTIAIVDDSEVVSIQAKKIIGDTDQQWYEVVLEGE